ncbi:MAG TPA: cupredoxin domain-containing protein [Acidimicrobiales bacterium]|jgi:plastocyanin|nr:cupredoxin domain-containing protein [Acidimicrobiales bacterium]
MTIIKNPIVLRRWVLAGAVVLGSIAAVGCSGDDDDDAATNDGGGGGGSAADVTYPVDALQYSDVSAPAGGTIEIQNNSGAAHTFTADDDSFDVSYGAGENATVDVPDEAGEYSFHCNIHASMTATLTAE